MTEAALQPTGDRPQLTLPPQEAAWVQSAYEQASCILEYGSGGSTVMAGEMPGKTVWSVESDRAWAGLMTDWFAAHPPRGTVNLRHVDIGPTGKWGYPTSQDAWRNYPRYPLAVWDAPGFTQPDLVLIDGRFRIGCFLAVQARTKGPVTLLFDDYLDRPIYHVVEDFAGPPAERRGRMARFEIEPRQVQGDELLAFVEAMGMPD